jgi:hypothetical protein
MITALAAIYLCAPTRAAEPLYIRSIGGDSCGKLIATGITSPGQSAVMEDVGRKFYDEGTLYNEWIAGFLTARNWDWVMTRDAPLSRQITVDNAGVTLWIRNWCTANPTQPIFQAAIAYADPHWKSVNVRP